MKRVLSMLLAALVFVGCQRPAQKIERDSTFERKIACAHLVANQKQWNNQPDGPYLRGVYYSGNRESCVVVLEQWFPGKDNQPALSNFQIYDALSLEQLLNRNAGNGETSETLKAEETNKLSLLQAK